jgi:phosphoglucosamine mutase
MMRLFGTDGIRARAFEPPLDEGTVRRLGAALAEQLGRQQWPPQLLLAGDTRASTDSLAGWLGGSFLAAGGRVTWAGVLPTPAVSLLLRSGSFAAGAVISASHNPAADNGIKILAPNGEKLGEDAELELETLVATVRPAAGPALPPRDRSLAARYLDILVATHGAGRPLAGLHCVVDAAHGAASGLAEIFLERLGARVSTVASAPDGSNINADCGATAPAMLAQAVLRLGADAGLALDGDADRALGVDETGRVLDGDDILLAWARHLAGEGRLPGRRVVATVMSNYGLERALAANGIAVTRCPVGDRAVWVTMQQCGAVLGGEQSGHVICSHHTVSGDGMVTGSHLLAIARASGRPASRLSDLCRLPQVLLNVPVRRKRPFEQLPGVQRELNRAQTRLDGRGRVLVRYSGTEPLARVMVEGDDAGEISLLADRLADALRLDLGA